MAASGAKYGIMTAHFYWIGAATLTLETTAATGTTSRLYDGQRHKLRQLHRALADHPARGQLGSCGRYGLCPRGCV